jgi:hypothetical protein
MRRSSVLVPAFALLAAAHVLSPASADAFESYRITGPIVHENLAVYSVHGPGTGTRPPLTLDSAMASGAAKIHETGKRPLVIENLSDQSIFVPFGALLVGGLQDQVARTSLIVPPRTSRSPLDVFCVDPFRSTARGSEDPKLFSVAGDLLPWQAARLSMLTGASASKAADRLRQVGVWWSIDSIRSALTHQLGEPPEPPRSAEWSTEPGREPLTATLLEARQSPSRTSLPLSLESNPLAQARERYVDAPAFAAATDGDVIGAVFVVNGTLLGAEIYGSNALFHQMWPKLLRAYATEALASKSGTAQALPSIEAVSSFLEAAQQGRVREQRLGRLVAVRDSDTAIYSEASAPGGDWVHRSYLSKLAAAPFTPEATVLGMLETGQVHGRAIASLNDRELLILQRDASGNGWSSTIRPLQDGLLHPTGLERTLVDWERSLTSPHRPRPGDRTDSGLPTVGWFAMAWIGWLLLASIRRRVAAMRSRRDGWHAHAIVRVRPRAARPPVVRQWWTHRVEPAWAACRRQASVWWRSLERHCSLARTALGHLLRSAAQSYVTLSQRAPLLKLS